MTIDCRSEPIWPTTGTGAAGYGLGMNDPYEVLQVHRRAEPEVIRAAYRALARKYHPDFGGEPSRMIAITEAWACRIEPGGRVAKPTVCAPAAPANAAAARPAMLSDFSMLISSLQ